MSPRILVLGGARSGKSRFAESLLADHPAVDYVATAAARPDDAEWTHRIAEHRARRPAHWTTLETADLAGVLRRNGPAVLVDSVTLWVGRTREDALDEQADELCAAWAETSRAAVLVSDEVGSGVVPATDSGRRFRDELGLLNQRLAATADEVHLVVAGLPLRLR
jgi:adenosylcobinamide kinase/adenosylcobinamide-phosphate guanylyltransferase